jgi:hypothetical protein
MSELFDVAAAEIAVPARDAFDYLADGIRQGEWTLGCWDRERAGDDLFRGRSLYDGRESYVRVLPHPDLLLVDFEVGPAPDALVRRISARVVERGPGTCVVTLMVWRTTDQDDASWRRVCELHRAEIHLIKGRLELGF